MKRVLLIEDELSIAELQKDYLEISGIEAMIAQDGNQGLQLALNETVDLILLDLMLPGIHGFELCQKIRKVKDIPIIIVSAKQEDIDKIRGLGLGADDYITKPFSPNELVARVKAHLARYERLTHKAELPNVMEIEGLVIDKLARQVFVFEEEVAFTAKEFDLLVYLAEHPHRVWNKEELFQQVWGLDSLGGDVSTVTVHIKRVREKIKQDEASLIYIETIWGSGYRFNFDETNGEIT